MTHSFSIKEAFVFGWGKVRAHSALVFQVVLTLLALEVALSIVEKVLAHSALGALAGIVLVIGSVVVSTGATLIGLRLARNEHASYNDLLPSWRVVLRFVLAGLLSGLAALVPLLVGAGVAAGIITLTHTPGELQYMGAQLHQAAWMHHHAHGYPMQPFGGNPLVDPVLRGALQVLLVCGALAIAGAVYASVRFSMARFAALDGAEPVESMRKSSQLTRGVKWRLLGFFIVAALINMAGAVLFLAPLLITLPVTLIAFAHVYDKLRGHHGHSHT